MNYYYLIASLPGLSINNPPPIPFNEFQSLCTEHLTKSDLKALEDLLEQPPAKKSGNDFVNNWRDVETQLRNAIAKLRASRLKIDASEFLREEKGYDSSIEKTVADAFSYDNPLERELALDKFRWDRIEDLAGFDSFTGKSVLAYTLKLLLAERWAKMNDETGNKSADDIINSSPEDEGKETPPSSAPEGKDKHE